MKFLKSALIISFLITNFVYSQTYEFLRMDYSPRAAAVAGSFVANYDDPNVIFYNPAGLNLIDDSKISFSYFNHLVDINSASLAMNYEFKGIGKFGIGIQYINYGTFKGKDELNNDLGNFSAGEFAFTLGYANFLSERFLYGINSKIIYSKINNISSSAIAFDAGLQYVIPESKFSLGFSVLNFGTQIDEYYSKKEDLPLDIKFGISKGLARVPLTLFFSFNRLNEDEGKFIERFNNFTFGGEIRMSKIFRARIGYDNNKRKDLYVGTTRGLAGFNLGIGASIKKYNFDYSFSSLGLVGSWHRIGLTFSL